MTCARAIIEAAADLDPDTYVPILDALDEDTEGLEPEEDEDAGWPVYINEYCPCCGSHVGTETVIT